MACLRYHALLAENPALPAHFADRDTVLSKLAELLAGAPGVVATRRGKLVGFLAALLLPNFRSRRGVYSPEWANAALLEDAGTIYPELYRAISADWVKNGYLTHALTIFANDRDGRNAWHWQGFGLIVADATRDLSPVQGVSGAADIRRVTANDLEEVKHLQLGLRRHLASAPIFLPMQTLWGSAEYAEIVTDPKVVAWLACADGRAVAFLRAETGNEGAGELVRDDATVAITGAYTEPMQRSGGLARALLQTAVHWAAEQGAARVSVDFETQNIDGGRFWLRHFQPVAYSLLRQVDDRILWAHAGREETAFW